MPVVKHSADPLPHMSGQRPAPHDKEVPIQVMVPAAVRRQVGLLCAERGESLRTLVLRSLQAVGVEVPEGELTDRRGRRPRR